MRTRDVMRQGAVGPGGGLHQVQNLQVSSHVSVCGERGEGRGGGGRGKWCGWLSEEETAASRATPTPYTPTSIPQNPLCAFGRLVHRNVQGHAVAHEVGGCQGGHQAAQRRGTRHCQHADGQGYGRQGRAGRGSDARRAHGTDSARLGVQAQGGQGGVVRGACAWVEPHSSGPHPCRPRAGRLEIGQGGGQEERVQVGPRADGGGGRGCCRLQACGRHPSLRVGAAPPAALMSSLRLTPDDRRPKAGTSKGAAHGQGQAIGRRRGCVAIKHGVAPRWHRCRDVLQGQDGGGHVDKSFPGLDGGGQQAEGGGAVERDAMVLHERGVPNPPISAPSRTNHQVDILHARPPLGPAHEVGSCRPGGRAACVSKEHRKGHRALPRPIPDGSLGRIAGASRCRQGPVGHEQEERGGQKGGAHEGGTWLAPRGQGRVGPVRAGRATRRVPGQGADYGRHSGDMGVAVATAARGGTEWGSRR